VVQGATSAISRYSGSPSGQLFDISCSDIRFEQRQILVQRRSESRILHTDVPPDGVIFSTVEQQEHIAVFHQEEIDDPLGAAFGSGIGLD